MDPKPNDPLNGGKAISSKSVSVQQAKMARNELERALSYHFRGDTPAAIKLLRKALQLDPSLEDEKLVGNLAHELTRLPVKEAVASLMAKNESAELIRTARRTRVNKPLSFRKIFVSTSLVISIIVLVVLSYNFFGSETFDSYFLAIKMARWEMQKQKLGGYEYYAIIPGGSPPETGWPVVVALHGMNGQGKNMLPFADMFLDEGIAFIAPTFGRYEPYPKGPIDILNNILLEVGDTQPIQARGCVLMGHSQGGTFAYRFSVYYPEHVAGVVTVGAPEFDSIAPARYDLPYVFTWGANDWLQDYMLPVAYSIQRGGFNVRIYLVSGAGHEMTTFAVEKALSMALLP